MSSTGFLGAMAVPGARCWRGGRSRSSFWTSLVILSLLRRRGSTGPNRGLCSSPPRAFRWSRPLRRMPSTPGSRSASTISSGSLELLRRTTFNALDGEKVVASLLKHRELWESFLLDRPGVPDYAEPRLLLIGGLIKLRDLAD